MDTIRRPGTVHATHSLAGERLLAAALVVALVLVVLGAWLRLVDAGWGCADWPACYAAAAGAPGTAFAAVQPLGAALVLALVARFWARQRLWPRPVDPEPLAALLWPARIAIVAIVAQIALGGWLVANHAALACPEFPTCRGQWWPAARFAAGFSAGFGALAGPGAQGASLSSDALVAIHLAHRLGALVALLVVGWAGWRALRSHGAHGLGAALLAALVAQWVVGVVGVVLALPLALAVAHHALAAVLLAAAVVLHFRAYRAQFWI